MPGPRLFFVDAGEKQGAWKALCSTLLIRGQALAQLEQLAHFPADPFVFVIDQLLKSF